MDVRTATADIVRFEAGGIVVGVFEGEDRLEGDAARIDEAVGGGISALASSGEIKGKLNQVAIVHSLGRLPAARIAVVGLGKKADLNTEKLRGAIAGACRTLRVSGAGTVASGTLGAGVGSTDRSQSAQSLTEGCLLGLYSFRKHMTKEPDNADISKFTIVDIDPAGMGSIQEGVRRGEIVARAVIQARDMVNEPANHMTPTDMANAAAEIARRTGVELTVLEREQVREMGMGAFAGVAEGSLQPPKFIVMRYRGRGGDEIDMALIGKGITFDSGGISIKPSEGMGDMKGDMAGGAAAMTALGAVAELKARVNVLVVIAATENLPSGNALKPGDVLKSLSGKTIEIISTDAEGRLTLADGIAYARQQGAKRMVDIATLTGAMRIALGDVCSGAFANNQELADRVIAAGREAGERMWQMPMYEEYKEQNKSDVADIKNTGGRYAGAITAAQFLAEFAGDTPWVHLDIAGTSMTEKERGYLVKGATGIPVRTLVNLVLGLG